MPSSKVKRRGDCPKSAAPKEGTPSPVAAISHTPGPWLISKWCRAETVVADENHKQIAVCEPLFRTDATNQANARLIAAAPELLRMLERFVNDVDDETCVEDGAQLIKKIKGGAQ